MQSARNFAKNFVKNRKIFFKKDLKFPDECVIIFRLTVNSDEAGGGHSAEFSPAFMGNFRGAAWLKAGRNIEEKQRKPYPWNCADWLRKPRLEWGFVRALCPVYFSPSGETPGCVLKNFPSKSFKVKF